MLTLPGNIFAFLAYVTAYYFTQKRTWVFSRAKHASDCGLVQGTHYKEEGQGSATESQGQEGRELGEHMGWWWSRPDPKNQGEKGLWVTPEEPHTEFWGLRGAAGTHRLKPNTEMPLSPPGRLPGGPCATETLGISGCLPLHHVQNRTARPRSQGSGSSGSRS